MTTPKEGSTLDTVLVIAISWTIGVCTGALLRWLGQ